MYYLLDSNNRIADFSESSIDPNKGAVIEAPVPNNTFAFPQWDNNAKQWIDGVTDDEMADIMRRQQENDEATREVDAVNTKLDLILELLQKKVE